MIDHASADERAALGIPGDAPGIAGAFGEQFEGPGSRMNAEQRAGELVGLPLVGHLAVIEHAVQAVEVAIRSPGQRVGKLVSVGASESGDDHR